MNPKEIAKLAFAHQGPDRALIFEIHIDAKPAHEILGHWISVSYGSERRQHEQGLCR